MVSGLHWIETGLCDGCLMYIWLVFCKTCDVCDFYGARERAGTDECMNGGRFEINQLLFADDSALVAVSEEKLHTLVSKHGRVSEGRKLRVNVGKSTVMRC